MACLKVRETYGISSSMPRQGNPYNNAMWRIFLHPEMRVHLQAETLIRKPGKEYD